MRYTLLFTSLIVSVIRNLHTWYSSAVCVCVSTESAKLHFLMKSNDTIINKL